MKKKVLFVSAANSIHTVKWVNALSKKYEIHLVYCKNHQPSIDSISDKVILHELRINSPLGYYLNSFELKKIYKEINPDVVNVHYASGYGTLVRIAGIKDVLLSVWGSDVYEFPNKSFVNKYILAKNVMWAKAIASTSNVMAIELKRQIPSLKKEVYITPFGVDTKKFKKFNVNRCDNNFNIGNIKKLEENYGIKDLILAIEFLINKLKNNDENEIADRIKLYIYGKGSLKCALEKLIVDHKLEKSVFLMGEVTNDSVPQELNKLDVFCVTSYNESFGVAVVEAMSCGIPVVATNVDGFREVVDDGKTGFIVEKNNIEEIANNLEKLLRNEELRHEFGKNGRKRVMKLYDWEKNVESMVELYNSFILEKRG